MIASAVEMLMDETPGGEVIQFLKKKNKKLSSLNAAMSLVRVALMKEENRSPECDFRDLATFKEKGIQEFIDSSLRDQYKIQREHRASKCWSDEAETALQKVRLLPTGIADFYLSKAECVELKRQQEASQKKKNESVITIEESEKLVACLSEMLRTCDASQSISRLAVSLLLCSGRRFIEIMNGKSTFQAVEGSEYHCIFTGQCKRKNKDVAYVIPLLCKFEDFNKTLIILREKQPPNIASYTNKEVSKMYQKQVRRPLDRFGFPLMPKCKIHDFRAAYCSFVYCMFDCPHTFASTACRRCWAQVNPRESFLQSY